MRFGCCGSMVAVEEDGTGVEIAEKLKEIGYDYIELSLTNIMTLSDEEFLKLKDRVALSGIKCEACNNFFSKDLRLTGPEVHMDKVMKYVERALNRASQLGAKCVVFGSGPAKMVPEGFSMDRAWTQLVDLLRRIDAVAEKYGITVVIEPLRKAECNIINTVADGLKLAKEVNRKSIMLLADFYHMSEEKEDPKILLDAKDYLRHVHFARYEGRMFPKVIDEDNYMPFINCLKGINYEGRVSVEAYSKEFYNDAVESLKFLRDYFQ